MPNTEKKTQKDWPNEDRKAYVVNEKKKKKKIKIAEKDFNEMETIYHIKSSN